MDIGLLKGDLSGTENLSDNGVVIPGMSSEEKLVLTNQDADAILSFFPSMQNNAYQNTSGNAVTFADVICIDDNDNIQKTDVARSDADADCTQLAERGKIYRYTGSGFDATDYSTGDVPLMNGATHYVYFLSDYLIPVFHCEFKTFGVYADWVIERWNGTAWTATGITDGTLGSTQDGDVNLGSITPANHPKVRVNGKYGHAFRIGCSGVTTQAILDVAYWQWNYELKKCALLGEAIFYDKTAGGVYSEVTPWAQYSNWGRVVFNADPLAAGSSLKAAYSYKNPQPGDYNLTFSDINTTAKTAKCQVNGGSDIGITCDNKTPNYQVIPGMYLIFNNASVLAVTDTTTISISESIKYLYYAKDTGAGPDTYYNGDLTLDDTPVNGNRTFYHGYFPPLAVDCTKNTHYTRINAYTE